MSRNLAIRDEVPEWNCWTRLPNIVLEKVDDPYELALLFAIRKVAGDSENGVCYMSTRTLAGITKMGHNTVKRKIHSLAEKGLIRAEKKKAPKKSPGPLSSKGTWEVWYIAFPRSVWEENEKAWKLAQRETNKQTVPEKTEKCTREIQKTVPDKDPTKNLPILRTNTKNHHLEAGGGDNALFIQFSEELLLEEDILSETAKELAGKVPLQDVASTIRALPPKGDVRDPGAVLVHRLRKGEFSRGASQGREHFRSDSLMYKLHWNETFWKDVEARNGFCANSIQSMKNLLGVGEA